MNLSQESIEHKMILDSLDQLLSDDYYLLENDLHEQAVTHRLGLYLQERFPQWNIDCEWNKNLAEKKAIYPKQLIEHMHEVAQYLTTKEETFVISAQASPKDVLSDIKSLNYLSCQLSENTQNQSIVNKITRLQYDEELNLWYFLLDLPDKMKEKKFIRPDIICHHRGTQDNKFAIEAKKSSGATISKQFDLIKLFCMTTQKDLKYERGYFIDFPVDSTLKQHTGFSIHLEKICCLKKVFSIQSNLREKE